MLQQSLAVFLVLGLLVAALWLLKRQGMASFGLGGSGATRIGSRSSDRQLRVIERLSLTPQHTLHLISLRDQMLLLATFPTGCQIVDTAAPVQGDGQERAASFKSGATC